LHVTFTNAHRFAVMVSLIVVVIVVALIMTVPFYGADSRDGQDWRPLQLASPLPNTEHSPPRTAKWPRVVARVGSRVKKLAHKK
jgi:hypothetical protein